MWFQKNLFGIFIGWFVIMIALSFVLGSDGKKLPTEPVLQTLESSELYFRNIRSNSYYLRTGTPKDVDIYQLKSFEVDSSSRTLVPLIVNNWRHNLAYIQLEPNFESDSYSLIFKSENETDTLTESFPQRVEQFRLAIRIYNAIELEQDVFLLVDGELQPLFHGEERKKRFGIVLKDYFRLVNVL
ncbi:hypothetical protein [Halocola ammonii]